MKCPKTKRCSWSKIRGIVLLWLWCLGGASAGPLTKLKDVDETLVNDVLVALEKAVSFFEDDYSDINMDGLYGIRICQGRVLECLEDCTSEDFMCPPDVVSRLEVVSEKLKNLSDNALPYVMEQHAAYAFNYIHIIEAPFHVKYIPEWLGDAIGPVGYDDDYSGPLGDACFGGMMGTYIDGDKLLPKCTIDDICWNFMTKLNTYDYYITHELLYFIYGEASGCTPVLENIVKDFNGGSVRDMEKGYCGRIYSEAKLLSKTGSVNPWKQDLFIEQSMLCGLLGFQDFFSAKWMRMVIGWQTPEGCWGIPQDLVYKRKMSYVVTALQAGGRKLMTEMQMKGDCLSHQSGLATGTLGVYLRFLLNQLYRLA